MGGVDTDHAAVPVEERQADHRFTQTRGSYARADRVDAPGHLESRRDRIAMQFARGRVQTHAHNAVGVVDPARLDRDPHLTRCWMRIVDLLDAQTVITARAVDADAFH